MLARAPTPRRSSNGGPPHPRRLGVDLFDGVSQFPLGAEPLGLEHVLHQGLAERLLAGPVVVDGGRGDARLAGHVPDPNLAEQLVRRRLLHHRDPRFEQGQLGPLPGLGVLAGSSGHGPTLPIIY